MANFSAGLPHPAQYAPASTTVRDLVTGLVWQRIPAADMTQPDAQTYCDDLVLDGACDWRLPERIELISIADYTRFNPTINPTVFPGTAANAYWSSTPHRDQTDRAWYVSFYNGLIDATVKVSPYDVRCVRGGAAPPPAHYTSTSTIVLDNGTGLTWERMVEVGTFNHSQAQSRCDLLAQDGGGWRSPSINELETLVDVTEVSPAIHSLTFPSTPASLFWSRDIQASDASQGWTVNFDNGTVARALTTALPVRCVR